jgi:hypothetical protein
MTAFDQAQIKKQGKLGESSFNNLHSVERDTFISGTKKGDLSTMAPETHRESMTPKESLIGA